MAEGFKGLSKEEHEKLGKAAHMYSTLTGDRLDVGAIPVAEPEKDAKAKAEADAKALEASAEATRAMEEGRQKERQIRTQQERGLTPGEENVSGASGPGQPAQVTERARAQGATSPDDQKREAKQK